MPATRTKTPAATTAAWLVLFHHVPPRPDYLRVRVGRGLRRLGAMPLKNSVYVLPNTTPHRTGFGALAREILERGGEAVIAEASWVEGVTDATLKDRFREARNAEYAKVGEAAARLAATLRRGGAPAAARRRVAARALARLHKTFHDIVARDPFESNGRDKAARLLSLIEDLLAGVADPKHADTALDEPPRGARWVTRAGVMVDRIASAWLIRRFIDRAARFKFVSGHGYRPVAGELRFDMSGGDFTHERDRCTFETLLERFHLGDAALRAIGEIVHDLDLEDDRYRRPEASGIGRMIVGIALNTADDVRRLEQGATLFDGLYESFRRHAR